MKAYQLVFIEDDRYEQHVSRTNTLYTSLEEAEKAKAWAETIPADPITPVTSIQIQEVDIVEKFVPWISEERLESMRQELLDFDPDQSVVREQDEAIYEAMLDATEPNWRDE